MTDQGAIESIAEALLGEHLFGCSNCGLDAEDWHEEAQRILDRLTADGYSVVKTEWEYAIREKKTGRTGAPSPSLAIIREAWAAFEESDDINETVRRTLWEPVPEGSEE